jgi:hypothetical protein
MCLRRFALGCLLLAACGLQNSPQYTIGTADPIYGGGGSVYPISRSFGRTQLERLHRRLSSQAFQNRLLKFNCGDPLPPLEFTVSLWREAEFQERHVLIQNRPTFSAGGPERCAAFGLSFLLDIEVAWLDHGPPINYHYHNPLTGLEFPPADYLRDSPKAPQCDCSMRYGKEEWVTWPSGEVTQTGK